MSGPVEIRRANSGESIIDEIVATGANFHMEQMSHNTYWFSLTIGEREWHFGLASETAISLICNDAPDEGEPLTLKSVATTPKRA
jgi:hypothetical protein